MLFTPDKLQSYILTEDTKLNPKKGYEIWFEGSAVAKQYAKVNKFKNYKEKS